MDKGHRRKIIGIVGPVGVGKSTLALSLVDNHLFVRAPLAEPIKRMLAALLEYQDVSQEDIIDMLYGDRKEDSSLYFNGRTPRHAMQTLGTEWRELVSRTLWTEVWKRRWIDTASNVVIDDVRFVHEVEVIRSLNGKIIQVTRQGFSIGIHQSETEYQSIAPDLVVDNHEGDVERMIAEVERWMQ